ncbi:hypothetical protein [Aquimarina latercula]|uniref:hypothetical protein n=1 Tax=Aquimarina latercula TaxID=987 RepID=UPI00041061C0|nr:hypothetical protein [Aquimarina latercula]
MKAIRLTFLFFISITFLFCSKNEGKNNNYINPPIIDSIHKKINQSKNKQLPNSQRLKSINEAILISKENQIDSFILKSISYKSTMHGSNKEYINAIKTTEDLIKTSLKFGDTSYLAKGYGKLARYYYKQDKITEAYTNYYKSFNLYKTINDSLKVAKQLRSIADIEKSFGDFISSEATCFKALKYLDTIQNPTQIAELYQIIAISSREQKDYKNALKYNKKAIQITTSNTHRSLYKNTKGVIYLKMKKYYDAIKVFEQLITDSLMIQDSKEKARVLSNLAFTKSKLNYTWTKKELLEALKIRENQKDIKGMIASNVHLAKYHIGRNKDSAMKYAKNAYQISKELKSISGTIESLDLIIQIDKNSLNQLLEYKKISDSINSSNSLSKNKFARIRYETEQKEKENLILKTENSQKALSLQKKETQNILYAGTGLLIILSSIFLFFYLGTKHKKEKLQEIYKTETRISKKVHDELANDVYQVMTQLQTKNNTDTTPVLDQLEDIYSRTRDISRENNRIETGAQYTDELRSMVSRYGSDQTNIIINGLTEEHWTNIPALKKIETYRVYRN